MDSVGGSIPGVPPNKWLIVHADDLGMAHSVNEATFLAMERGLVSSASVMAPCPWTAEVACYLQHHPSRDIGVHITLTSEWNGYKWRPVADPTSVPSLIDAHGYLWPDESSVVKHAQPRDVEREIRAQIGMAVRLGLKPSHLDTHMFVLWSAPHLFAAFAKVAHEYSLPFLALKTLHLQSPFLNSLRPGDVLVDNIVRIRPHVTPAEWNCWYLQTLGMIGHGITQLIVHVGRDDSELRAITNGVDAWGSSWRERDLTAVTSTAMRQVCRENGIRIVSWRDLRALPASRSAWKGVKPGDDCGEATEESISGRQMSIVL